MAAAANGIVDEADWAHLDALAQQWDLTTEERESIEGPVRRGMIQHHVDSFVASGEFDPATAKAFAVWTQAMRGSADDIEPSQLAELEHLARAWSLANEALPLEEVPIALQRGELCHAQAAVIWSELRSSGYSASAGPIIRVPVVAGLSFRVAAYKQTRLAVERLEGIDHGALYVTNKRLIFNGTKRNTTIRLNAVLNVTPHENGIVIEKSSGRSPHLQLFGSDPLHFATILRRVIAEANA